MRKNISLILVLLCIIALFASCADSDSGGPATQTPANTPTTSKEPGTPTVDEEDPHDLLEDIADYKSADLLSEALAVPGDVPPSKLPIGDGETISIWSTGLGPETGMVDFSEGEMWKEYSKRLGVNFEFFMGASTNERETFVLHIMSEDYADILGHTQNYVGGIDKAVDDEVFIPLDDYIEWIPHYMAVVNYSEATRTDARTDGGRMAQFCNATFNSKPLNINGMVFRRDLFEKSGWNNGVLPETFDEWGEMLTFFRDEMNMPGALTINSAGVETFNSAMLRGLGLTHTYILRDRKVEYARISDEYKTYLEYMNKWYSEKLIYQDFYSRRVNDQYNMMVEKCAGTDELLVLNGWTAFAGTFYMRTGVAINPDFFIAAIKDPVLNKGEKPMFSGFSPESLRLSSNNGFAVSTGAEDPILCMRILDYMYSTEGALLTSYGPWLGESASSPDATYYYDNGRPIVTDLLANNPSGLPMSAAFQKYAWHLRAPYLIWDRESDIYTEDMAITMDVWGDTVTVLDGKQVLPFNYSTTAEEGAEISNIMGDIETYVSEMTVKFIIGTEPLDSYDDYVAKIKSEDIDRVCELLQQAVDRYYSRGK